MASALVAPLFVIRSTFSCSILFNAFAFVEEIPARILETCALNVSNAFATPGPLLFTRIVITLFKISSDAFK